MKTVSYCIFLVLLLITAVWLSVSRTVSPSPLGEVVYTVEVTPFHQTMHFSGFIQPIKTTALVSPVDATVENVHFNYGDHVRKEAVIVVLNSAALQKLYHDTLTEYLKAKDNFNITSARFAGTQELWREGLIAKNNFLSEKSNVSTAQVALMQATRQLKELQEKMDDTQQENWSTLSIAEFTKVQQALNVAHRLVSLKTKENGLLLDPPKGGSEKASPLAVGSAVKAGDIIAVVGDVSGIRVEIAIPEIDVDKVCPGMKATISGVALGKTMLDGVVIRVNAQATTSNSNTLPSFTAVVEVKTLPTAVRQLIKVGMSAAVALEYDSKNKLTVPIAALSHHGEQTFVTVQKTNGQREKRSVVTREALSSQVVIERGLKPGEVIVYGG